MIVVSAVIVTACGGGQPPSAPPVAVVAPLVTPDPHLHEPATADQVFRALSAGGLQMVANNALSGASGAEPVKRINATYLGWPLNVAQYSSSAALSKVTQWKDGEPPRGGEVPIAIVGLNILVTWGPTTGGKPRVPDARKVNALDPLVKILDGLLSPLRARANVPLAIAGPSAAPSPPASARPAAASPVKASPKPSRKPKKPSPKP